MKMAALGKISRLFRRRVARRLNSLRYKKRDESPSEGVHTFTLRYHIYTPLTSTLLLCAVVILDFSPRPVLDFTSNIWMRIS